METKQYEKNAKSVLREVSPVVSPPIEDLYRVKKKALSGDFMISGNIIFYKLAACLNLDFGLMISKSVKKKIQLYLRYLFVCVCFSFALVFCIYK